MADSAAYGCPVAKFIYRSRKRVIEVEIGLPWRSTIVGAIVAWARHHWFGD